MSTPLQWRIRKHLLLFAVGILVGSYLLFLLASAALWLGIAVVREDQSIRMHGGTALLLNCLLFGALFFSMAAAVAKRFLAEPVYWLFAVVGGIYPAGAFMVALFIPTARGALGGILLSAWLILFPGLAVLVSSLLLKRLNPAFNLALRKKPRQTD